MPFITSISQLFSFKNLFYDLLTLPFYIFLFLLISLIATIIIRKISSSYFDSLPNLSFGVFSDPPKIAPNYLPYLSFFARNAFFISILHTFLYHFINGSFLSSVMKAFAAADARQLFSSIAIIILLSLLTAYIAAHSFFAASLFTAIALIFSVITHSGLVVFFLLVSILSIPLITNQSILDVIYPPSSPTSPTSSSTKQSIRLASIVFTTHFFKIFFIIFSASIINTIMGQLILDTLTNSSSLLHLILCVCKCALVFSVTRGLINAIIASYVYSIIHNKPRPLRAIFTAIDSIFDPICYIAVFISIIKVIRYMARAVLKQLENNSIQESSILAIITLICIGVESLIEKFIVVTEVYSDMLFSRIAIYAISSDSAEMESARKLREMGKKKLRTFLSSSRAIKAGLISVIAGVLIYFLKEAVAPSDATPLQAANITPMVTNNIDTVLTGAVFVFMVMLNFSVAYSSAIVAIEYSEEDVKVQEMEPTVEETEDSYNYKYMLMYDDDDEGYESNEAS